MVNNRRFALSARSLWVWHLIALALLVSGCEIDSFMNPSVVGRWERTPVVLPILDQLDIIDEPSSKAAGLSQIMPQDLVPEIREYVIGPGDVVTASVFELMTPGQDSVQTFRVDPLGNVRLRVIGPLKMSGLTPTQLEEKIISVLERKGILKDPMVTIIVDQPRQQTYTVIGEPRASGTVVGTFAILRSDFRLLEAMALARGVSGRIKKIYVIRQVALGEAAVDPTFGTEPAEPQDDLDFLDDPTKLFDQALDGEDGADAGASPAPEAAPQPVDQTMDSASAGPQWVHVGGKWVQVDSSGSAVGPASAAGSDGSDASTPPVVTQRIIEVPYNKLLEGEMQYNIVIRPRDIISVPSPVIGNVFIMGAINRPGTFALPGDKDLTLKLLIAAAGGLNGLAWPERVDLVRRIGEKQEATVRLDVRAIFDGRQPDFFLKPNDMINIGQSFLSTPLAVVRNGFRTTYGFGFILDRNFGIDVFRELNEISRPGR